MKLYVLGGIDTYRPLRIIAKRAVIISPPCAFPWIIKNLPTQSCNAQEHIARPYVNPRPRPWTRLINIPYLRVACNDVAYEYLAKVSFVNAYNVLK